MRCHAANTGIMYLLVATLQPVSLGEPQGGTALTGGRGHPLEPPLTINTVDGREITWSQNLPYLKIYLTSATLHKVKKSFYRSFIGIHCV